MTIIYLNEMKNISMFLYKFKYIKDYSKIIMEQKCNNIYCEAETDRYQIAKNSYKLLMPNDIFNSKTYIIMTFIVSIMIYIYYYYLLFDSTESDKFYYLLHFILLIILIAMIILRYTPYDEAGYLNYFRDFNKNGESFKNFVIFSMVIIIPITIFQLKKKQLNTNPQIVIPIIIKFICYIISIIIIFNLMNIVMSFRSNTKPILKTINLSVSLEKSFKILDTYFEAEGKSSILKDSIKPEYDIFIDLKDNIINKYCKDDTRDSKVDPETSVAKTNEAIISSILKILRAFNELSLITLNELKDTSNEANTKYIESLKKIIKDNYDYLNNNYKKEKKSYISEVSLIYDEPVKIPYSYDYHNDNRNENNSDYIYTSDISYNSPNLFYEKYWDIDLDNVLTKYDYFVPTMLLFGSRPNIFKIIIMVFIILIIILSLYAIHVLIAFYQPDYVIEYSIFTILQPFIMFIILIVFIGIFISFNTWFNKYVVYMCLDSSYKRSLNKLNNIVSPYIQMYDNKVVKSNKSYIRHYIITNVFYSILSGNIKLNDGNSISPTISVTPINESEDDSKYYNIQNIKDGNLKFSNMNNYILNNDEEFKKYYDERFKGIYNPIHDNARVDTLYNVFNKIFAPLNDEDALINNYFKNVIFSIDINKGTLSKIYYIIKKCFELFNEEKFNNNLRYYNDKGTTYIDKYNKFKFLKSTALDNKNKVIPYKFILTLNTINEYNAFITDDNVPDRFVTELNENLKNNFDITIINGVNTDITKILEDNDDNDIPNQASDIEKKQDKNLLKIIAKYLLILGHINYNRIQYNNTNDILKKKDIYERKSANLYKLISDTLYIDTYLIDDTFNIDDCITNCKSYIEYIEITNAGIGYTSAPTIEFSGGNPTTIANARAILSKTISNITVSIGGSGYKIAPTIEFMGGGGSGASAKATIDNGVLKTIRVVNGGTGYTSEPTIRIIGGGSPTTIAIANTNIINGIVTSINVVNGGLDYKSVPTIKFIGGGDGSGAEATAIMDNGVIKSITVVNGGKGYSSNTKIEFIGGGPSIIATAQATLSPLTITSIIVENRGSGYTSKPTIRITGGGGSGAEAIAYMQKRIIEEPKYKKLTYIYNYLERKYVNVSSTTNKNYLMNVITTINNKINDNDGKTFNNNDNTTLYMFRDKINNMNNPKEYDNEDDILNIANNISTTSFGATYIFNIIIMLICYNIISRTIK